MLDLGPSGPSKEDMVLRMSSTLDGAHRRLRARAKLLHGCGLAGAAILGWGCAGDGSEHAFDQNAPVVVESAPRDGDVDVDASLQAITATFSQAMDLGGWSWVTEVGHSAPSITGLPYYLDETTTVLPVQLEPATTYVLWVNSPDDAELRNFMSPEGVAARAHRIRFTTAR
jgi:Big-like domain-containing protein